MKDHERALRQVRDKQLNIDEHSMSEHVHHTLTIVNNCLTLFFCDDPFFRATWHRDAPRHRRPPRDSSWRCGMKDLPPGNLHNSWGSQTEIDQRCANSDSVYVGFMCFIENSLRIHWVRHVETCWFDDVWWRWMCDRYIISEAACLMLSRSVKMRVKLRMWHVIQVRPNTHRFSD